MIFCQMIVTFIGNVIKSLTIQGLHDNVFTKATVYDDKVEFKNKF